MASSAQRSVSNSYYGRRTSNYETGDFQLAESVYGGAAELPFHEHDNPHFCLVLSGSYVEKLADDEAERRPGDLMFYPAGAGHAERHRVRGRHFLIELGPALGALLEGSRERVVWTSTRGATRTEATRLFAAFRGAEGPAPALPELVRSLVDSALSRSEKRGPRRSWLTEVERWLRETEAARPDLDSLARRAGVHPVYLGRAFRAAFGCSPGEYLRRLRVERAQRALGDCNSQLADVAYASGFCDQSHLNRVFKRQIGTTPGRYQRLAAPS